MKFPLDLNNHWNCAKNDASGPQQSPATENAFVVEPISLHAACDHARVTEVTPRFAGERIRSAKMAHNTSKILWL
jgi:hypothetical protein